MQLFFPYNKWQRKTNISNKKNETIMRIIWVRKLSVGSLVNSSVVNIVWFSYRPLRCRCCSTAARNLTFVQMNFNDICPCVRRARACGYMCCALHWCARASPCSYTTKHILHHIHSSLQWSTWYMCVCVVFIIPTVLDCQHTSLHTLLIHCWIRQ